MNVVQILVFNMCFFITLEELTSNWANRTINTLKLDPSLIELVDKVLIQVKDIHVYFDDCEVDDAFLKYLIDSNISISIDNMNINFRDYEYLLIVTKSITKLTNSTFLNIDSKMMRNKIKIIIYNKGRDGSDYFLNDLSSCFHFADVLYINRSSFYYLSSPLFRNRTFLKKQKHAINTWNSDTKKLPNLQGSLLHVVTYNNPIYFIIDKVEKNQEEKYNGIEMQILIEIAKQLNFSWKLKIVNMKDGWVGIYQEILQGTSDIGFGGLWILPDQEFKQYTKPWTKVAMGFLVPRPRLDNRSWMNVLKPFSLELWLFNIVAVMITPLVLWCLFKLSSSLKENTARGKMLSLACSYLYMFGVFCQVSSQLSTRKETAIRYLFLSWNIFVLMMATAYSSCIIARLTSPSSMSPIDTTKQLVEQNIKWGKTFPVQQLSLQLNLNNEWNKKFAERYKVYTESEIAELLKSNSFAVYTKLLDNYHAFYTHDIDSEILSNLRVMKERVITHDLSFTLQRNSPLLDGFNVVFTRLCESGVTSYIKEHVARIYSSPLNQQVFIDRINHNNELTSLSLRNLQGAFYILIFGLILATVCFLFEISTKRSIKVV